MSNWVVFMVFTFITMQILSLILEGEVGIVTAQLQSGVGNTTTTLVVNSTDGFIDSDFVILGNEEICYEGKTATTFTGLTRGCRGTDVEDHRAGVRVYNDSTGLMNRMIGFNILQTLANDGFIAGTLKVITNVPTIARSFAQMAIWDYSMYEGQMVYFKYIVLYPISAGLIFMLFRLVLRR